MAAEGDAWVMLRTAEGKPYFYNRARKETRWTLPEGFTAVDPTATAAAATVRAAAPQPAEPQPAPNGPCAEKEGEMPHRLGRKSRRSSFEELAAADSRIKAGKRQQAKEKSRDGLEPKLVTTPLPKRRPCENTPQTASATREAHRRPPPAVPTPGQSQDQRQPKEQPKEQLEQLEPPEQQQQQPEQQQQQQPEQQQQQQQKQQKPEQQPKENREDERWRVWQKKMTATFGDSAQGDVFYVNTETGETQWDRPDEYESEDEHAQRAEVEEIAFDRDLSVQQVLEQLGAAPSGSMDADRIAMLAASEGAQERCAQRLRQIFLAIKYCGSPEEWEAAAARDDFFLVRSIVLHWAPQGGAGTPAEVRALACILVETLSKLDGTMVQRLVDGSWGLGLADVVANLRLGLAEAASDDPSTFSWLSLLYSVLGAAPRLPPAGAPDDVLVSALLSKLSAKEEDVFLMAAYALVATNAHCGLTAELAPDEALDEAGDADLRATLKHRPNAVMRALQASPTSAELLSEAVMHLLNAQSYPYDDPALLGQLLRFVRTVFSTVATRDVLHTTDLHVLVDMILSQLRNLPPEDGFRVDYLRLLHLILINAPRWRKYRREEIDAALHSVLAAGPSGLAPLVCTVAARILVECVDQLE